MATADDTKLIKIVVKTPQNKQVIEINENAKIEELKGLVASKFDSEIDRLCLIFAGKILKDNDTLDQHKITDGLTIHLVIRPKKKPESQNNENDKTSSSTTQSSNTNTDTTSTNTSTNTSTTNPPPNPFAAFSGLGDLGGFGRDILNNPEMTSQLFNNPLIQDLMSNPDNIRAMLNMNPQMQQLIERNPEINHLLNNNDILRHSMEMIRNPAAFQELMRTQDRALSNLESIPGGYNALRRMYTELHEPMLNAASENLMGENPFASFARQNNNSNSGTTQPNTDNAQQYPFPNPWSRENQTPSSNNSQTSNNSTTGTNRSTAANPLGNSNMLSQLMGNSDLMNSIMNSPQTQQMMQQMMSNPEAMQQLLANNPLLNADPNLTQQMSSLLPNAFQQMQSPEIRQALSNPEAIEAMMQITRGMEQLQRTAPALFNMMSANSGGNLFGAGNSTSTTTNSTTNTTTPNVNSISQLNNLMSQMFSGGLPGANNTATQQSQQPPEERYRNQLEQLSQMGFPDRAQNLQALIETLGDVNGAIERLLNRGSYFS